MKLKTPSTAFVLGAGLGTRLRPLTDELPKPLLPVGGRPMIESCFEQLRRAGVRRILVNTHWKPEAYARAYPDNRWGDVELVFVHEPVLLETGGGLKAIEPLLGPDDDSLWIYNGDVFAGPDLEKLWRDHASSGAEATLLLRGAGNVRVDTSGAIVDVRGRRGVTAGESRQFSGISLVSRKFFRHLRAGVIESLVEGWLRAIEENPGSVRGVTDNAFRWTDLGTAAEYEAIRLRSPHEIFATENTDELGNKWVHSVTFRVFRGKKAASISFSFHDSLRTRTTRRACGARRR